MQTTNKTNMKPILSIIVPSYKTTPFLHYTLPPFIDDRLKGRIIVLLVDDGSPDSTLKELKKWEKNPWCFKVHHKENGGHGSVINYAVHNIVNTKFFWLLMVMTMLILMV